MNYIIFDDLAHANFFPLTITRATCDLRVGALKLRQRICGYLDIKYADIVVSSELTALYQERYQSFKTNQLVADDTIFINSRVQISDELVKDIKALKTNTCLSSGDTILTARLTPTITNICSDRLMAMLQKCKKIEYQHTCWEYLWDFVHANSKMLWQDFEDFFYEKDNHFDTETGVTILNPYNVWIGEGAKLSPGVIIDAGAGPVIIDEAAMIMPNACIIGPAYIGKNTVIKVGAKIYEGTTLGPSCKIGGEVEESIIHGYSNKQHDGFLGHSYLGEWVNLGADTNNSDLKNNYSYVKCYVYPLAQQISTNSLFVGAMIGDHVKTGINSTINTGTVIGLGSNLYGQEIISGFVPDFSWGSAHNLSTYQLDKFLATCEVVKKRRNQPSSEEEKRLYNYLHKQKK